MKKTLSSIAIAFTLIFSTGVVSPSPVLAAPATTATQSLTKFYQSLPSDPGKLKPEQIQEVKNRLNIGSMEILILFVSGIIAAGLLKMADSLASTFGGDSGIGQISSNVSQSMTMMGMTGVSKAYGASKTLAGLGVAGAAAGWKKFKNKGNKFDAGGDGGESTARTPKEFNDGGEKSDGEKNENPTPPQQENPPPTNDKDNPPPTNDKDNPPQTNDKPTSQGDDHRDDADKNAYDNEEMKEEKTEKIETTETVEKTPAGEKTAIPVAPKNETESTGTPNPTPDNPTPTNPTPDNPTPAPVTTPATPPASKPLELPKHEG